MNYLFRILYKISLKKNISFNNIDINNILIENMTPEQLEIINYLKNKNKIHLLKKFIVYYQENYNKKKNLLILPFGLPKNLYEKYKKNNVIVTKDNILDGFKYLDKKKYILYDYSLISKLLNEKLKYIERIQNEY
jgi:hypothetical protein